MRACMRCWPASIVRVPALRERAEDVPELANLVLSRAIEAKEVRRAQLQHGGAECAAQLPLARATWCSSKAW